MTATTPDPKAIIRVFAARYPDVCEDCGNVIRPTETMGVCANGEYRCRNCIEDPE